VTDYLTTFKDRPILYLSPDDDQVVVDRDLVYRPGDQPGKPNIYRPTHATSVVPAVVSVHGDGPRAVIADSKDWAHYTTWARLVTTIGAAGVTFNYRSSHRLAEVRITLQDVRTLFDQVRSHAQPYGLDPDRIAVWAHGNAVPYGWAPLLARQPSWLRALVAYHGWMDLRAVGHQFDPAADPGLLANLSPISLLETAITPMLVVRAGRDAPEVNRIIDTFTAQAFTANSALQLTNHPEGRHLFDILDDNATIRWIIQGTLEFLADHLS